MIHERHTTDVQVGDIFEFRGLTGQDVLENTRMKIKGIGVTGWVEFRYIDGRGMEENLERVPLTDLLPLIEQGIWCPA